MFLLIPAPAHAAISTFNAQENPLRGRHVRPDTDTCPRDPRSDSSRNHSYRGVISMEIPDSSAPLDIVVRRPSDTTHRTKFFFFFFKKRPRRLWSRRIQMMTRLNKGAFHADFSVMPGRRLQSKRWSDRLHPDLESSPRDAWNMQRPSGHAKARQHFGDETII